LAAYLQAKETIQDSLKRWEIYFYHISLSLFSSLSALCSKHLLAHISTYICNAHNDETQDVWAFTFAINRAQLMLYM
jgi:hypothetical protein